MNPCWFIIRFLKYQAFFFFFAPREAHQSLKQVRQKHQNLKPVIPVIIRFEFVLSCASCCLLFVSRQTGEERPNPKHDHMFKPCPMNPKQDVTAGPPVRVTDMDTGAQEGYCLVLLWERQSEGKGSVGRDRLDVCMCFPVRDLKTSEAI